MKLHLNSNVHVHVAIEKGVWGILPYSYLAYMADSSGGRNVNAISKLLSNDENILVATILGHGNQVYII